MGGFNKFNYFNISYFNISTPPPVPSSRAGMVEIERSSKSRTFIKYDGNIVVTYYSCGHFCYAIQSAKECCICSGTPVQTWCALCTAVVASDHVLKPKSGEPA